MLDQTSEQRLKALEHSKKDPSDLLDEATAIAGAEFEFYQQDYNGLTHDFSKRSDTFREEWLLRWMLKKFNEAVQAGVDKRKDNALNRFLVNTKAWSFLSYLLSAIPKQKTVEILLQRSFVKVLTSASAILIENKYQTVKTASSLLINGNVEEPPRKRLRLSPDAEAGDEVVVDTYTTHVMETPCLFQYIKVVSILGSLLQLTELPSSNTARTVTPAWADTTTDAAQFISSTLKSAQSLLQVSLSHPSQQLITDTMATWLRLWHTFSSSNNATDRAVAGKIFTETCLNTCLDVYGILLKLQESKYIPAKQELEKQIALYTIFPLRSVFNSKHAGRWKTNREVTSWQDIEPVFKMITNHFGAALHSEEATGFETIGLNDAKYASYILSIATRLVPKHDVRQRVKEGPWTEALLLCLIHLAFPKEMPHMLADAENILQPQMDGLPPSSKAATKWPDELFSIVADEELQITTTTREYLIMGILSWRIQPLPLSLLSTIVHLDPNAFVPNIGGTNSSACLEGLLAAAGAHKTINESEYEIVVHDLICPLLQAFARAREFPGLIKMWLPNLEEAIRVRASTIFQPDDVPHALVWDDEDVFIEFSKQCQQYGVTNFGQKLLEEVIKEMQGMSDRVGPTTDVFGRLAILESFVDGTGSDVLASEEMTTSLNSLSDLLVSALQQKNDYQGQRWRLWSLMVRLGRLNTQLGRADGITKILKDSTERLHSLNTQVINQLQQGQRSALLKEQYTIFSLLLDQDSMALASKKTSKMLHQMTTSIARLGQASNTTNTIGNSILWDGRINNLRSIEHFIQACLARLIQQRDDFASLSDVLSPLLMSLVAQTGGKEVNTKFITNKLAILLPRREKTVGTGRNEDAETTLSERNPTYENLEKLAAKAQNGATETKQSKTAELLGEQLNSSQLDSLTTTFNVGALVSHSNDDELKIMPEIAKTIASTLTLQPPGIHLTLPSIVLRVELCMLTLKQQPNVVHQAIIDNLLTELAIVSSSAIKFDGSTSPASEKDITHGSQAVFERLVGTVGILLTKYRRRLAGRTHLLLPVLQNLLKCFFYTPRRTYIYQNAATAKQKQAFRASLPAWMEGDVLPVSSAVKFSKILSSICNPTTASARSAHPTRRNNGAASLSLNDETKKARRIAAQYMQYLIMEYARSSLDGVIQPEVREKLMPGIYSIFDAMDRDLMKAMNSAMDPSSRAIFKGLYEDWVKHWRWDQN